MDYLREMVTADDRWEAINKAKKELEKHHPHMERWEVLEITSVGKKYAVKFKGE